MDLETVADDAVAGGFGIHIERHRDTFAAKGGIADRHLGRARRDIKWDAALPGECVVIERDTGRRCRLRPRRMAGIQRGQPHLLRLAVSPETFDPDIADDVAIAHGDILRAIPCAVGPFQRADPECADTGCGAGKRRTMAIERQAGAPAPE